MCLFSCVFLKVLIIWMFSACFRIFYINFYLKFENKLKYIKYFPTAFSKKINRRHITDNQHTLLLYMKQILVMKMLA